MALKTRLYREDGTGVLISAVSIRPSQKIWDYLAGRDCKDHEVMVFQFDQNGVVDYSQDAPDQYQYQYDFWYMAEAKFETVRARYKRQGLVER